MSTNYTVGSSAVPGSGFSHTGYIFSPMDSGTAVNWLAGLGLGRDTNPYGSVLAGGVRLPSETETVNNALNQYMREQEFLANQYYQQQNFLQQGTQFQYQQAQFAHEQQKWAQENQKYADQQALRGQILEMLQGGGMGSSYQQPTQAQGGSPWEKYLNEALAANYSLASQQMAGADTAATAELQRLYRDRAANYGTTEARMTARGLGSSNLVNAAVNDVTDTYNRSMNDVNATTAAQKQAIYAGANQSSQAAYLAAMQAQSQNAQLQQAQQNQAMQQAQSQQNMLFSALLGTF